FSSSAMSVAQFAFVVQAALPRHGERASEVAARRPQAAGVLQLTGRILEAQAEQVPARGADVLDEHVIGHVVDLCRLGHRYPSRSPTFVLPGSLCPARRIASRASGSDTPASSNIPRPGRTTATQPSGLPLPEPMRVSAGFWVIGLSG